MFAELTTALADLTAKRNQLESGVRGHRDRLTRLDQDIANVQAEELKLAQETSALGDLAALSAATETAQEHLAESETGAQASEAAHVAARAKLEAARAPLAEADKRVQRLETEARTISKIVNGETKNLWPPIIDGVTVAKGYEKALGAALGDDLDAPVDPSAPMRWTNADAVAEDPALPEGVEPLAAHVQAPSELARRLKQIGVVPKERGAEFVSQLKTGQRLVSPEGDVWRWDGFVAAAHAPTGAARRLAERARLVDIENELEQARDDASAKRQALETAEAEAKAASDAESAARDAWRAAQREADAARERHATTEREINRHSARKSALFEAYSRLTIDRTEVEGAHQNASAALAELAARSRDRNQARCRSRRNRRPPPSLPRKCGPRGRRSRARPNWPTGACRRSPPSATIGKAARPARPRRSRPSKPASPRSRPSVPNLTMRRQCLRKSAAR